MLKQQIFSDFTAGILSSRWKGRMDADLYRKGAQDLLNFIPFFPGGVALRPGTFYCGALASSKVRLVPFIISSSVAYVLEFRQNAIRFWRDGQLLLDNSVPVSAATTYTDLSALKFAQDGTKLFMVDGSHTIKVLEMTALDTFTFGDLEITYITGMKPFAATGDYPRAIAIHDGRLYLAGTDNEPQTIWASEPYDYGNFTYYDTIEYTSQELREAVNTFTGTTASGSSRITGISATEIAGFKVGDMIKGPGIPYTYGSVYTYIGAIGADYIDLIDASGAAALATASASSITLYDGYHDPTVPEYKDVPYTRDVITSSSAFKKTIAGKQNETILWLEAGNDLIVGTSSGERIIPAGTNSSNFTCKPQTSYGSDKIQPVTMADTTIFATPDRKSARQYVYSADSERYAAPKFNYLADESLDGIVDMDYQSHDTPIIWFVLDDGTVSGCIYDLALKMQAFFRCNFSGLVESIAVIPEDGADTVYLSVNQSGARILVKMDSLFSTMHLDDAAEKTVASRLISGLTWLSGSATLVYSGKVYAVNVTDGVAAAPADIANGSVVTVGKAFTATLKTMPVIGDMREKTIPRTIVRVQESYPFKVGFEALAQETAVFTGPFSGDVKIPMVSNWNTQGAVVITQTEPLDVTILALLAEVDIGG